MKIQPSPASHLFSTQEREIILNLLKLILSFSIGNEVINFQELELLSGKILSKVHFVDEEIEFIAEKLHESVENEDKNGIVENATSLLLCMDFVKS